MDAAPEVRFFLHRALDVATLPDQAQGILTTAPPCPLLFALAFGKFFPFVVEAIIVAVLVLFGIRKKHLLSVVFAVTSPAFFLSVLEKPALALAALGFAFAFSSLLQSAGTQNPQGLLLGNLVFGVTALLHPLSLWVLPLFVLCEVLFFRTSLTRRGTLAVLALFPFLVLQGMVGFFGWVYEGHALLPFRDPGFSLAAFLRLAGEAPLSWSDLTPLLLLPAFWHSVHALVPFLSLSVLTLGAHTLSHPGTSLAPLFLLISAPHLSKGALPAVLSWNVASWVLYLLGIPFG